MSLHNLWCTKKYVEELDNALNRDKDKDKFFELTKKHTGNSKKTLHAINFIEDCIKYGFKTTYDIYLRDHNFNKPKLKQRKLF